MTDYYSRTVVRPHLPLTETQQRLLSYTGEEEGCEPAVRALAQDLKFDGDTNCAGTEYYICKNDTFYLYCEENLPEGLVPFLQHVLEGLPADRFPYIEVEVGYSCTKMRSDGFGGSAYFITRDGVDEVHTARWLSDRVADYGAMHKNG